MQNKHLTFSNFKKDKGLDQQQGRTNPAGRVRSFLKYGLAAGLLFVTAAFSACPEDGSTVDTPQKREINIKGKYSCPVTSDS